MKRILVFAMIMLLGAGTAQAQFDIHLKNGSVIKHVRSYEKRGGMVLFELAGGQVAVAETDVLRIVEGGVKGRVYAPSAPPSTAAAPAAPPPPALMTVDTGPLERRLSEINGRLSEIKAAEDDLNSLRKDLQWVRLRIEILFQRGVANAKKANGDPAQWFKFLDPQDREFAQLNTLKKNKLLKELPAAEEKYAPLIAEKPGLLAEKESLEKELREASSY